MNTRIKLAIFILPSALSLEMAIALHAATSIDAVNRYAYGANVGWMDLRGDTNNGVIIGPKYCSGYLYSANVGWISLGNGVPTNGVQYQNASANDYGVNVDSFGNLRGYAYGANIGWINFEGNGAPAVNFTSGNLSGYAYGANLGWISLSNSVAFVKTASFTPPNDFCAGAIPLTNGVAYAQNTIAATSTGDPVPSCPYAFGNGVWFTYTPMLNGPVTVSTCASDFDTGMGVYTGTCGAFTEIACNDDYGPSCNSTRASVLFTGTAGVTYYILAGGYGSNTGNLNIVANSPWNDQCSGAVPLTDGVPFTMSTTNATSTGDPAPVCVPSLGNGVWFTYTAPASGNVYISTCGSDFDTAMGVYTGNCGALTQIACDDDYGPSCQGFQASVRLVATAGATYYILAGGYAGKTGNLAIEAYLVPVLNVSQSSSNINITWPGNGTLQSATNLNPVINWTDLTNGGGLWSEPMTNPVKFFRIVK